jgi:flagellar biosynthetic protein FlhB
MAESEDGQEKTEEATPRKREEAREKGQVALSQDVVSALSLSAAAGALFLGGSALAESAAVLLRTSVANLATIGPVDMPLESWADLLTGSTTSMALPVALVVGPLLATGIFAGYAQVGFQFSPKALEWDLSRLSPAKGWQKIAGVRGVARTLQSSFKILLVGAAAVWATWASIDDLPMLAGAPVHAVLAGLGGVLAHVAGASIGTFAFLAIVDMMYQRWQHGQDLRMTREEVRQEFKNSEGDPQLKARVRDAQRRIARQRMIFDVPAASVVITNPTHVAVALKWDGDAADGERGASAPVVVAKGVDFVAQRIKEVAREANVPLREDVPLARALHAQCEIGDEIPAGLYQAVAAVLAQVWNLAPESGKEA